MKFEWLVFDDKELMLCAGSSWYILFSGPRGGFSLNNVGHIITRVAARSVADYMTDGSRWRRLDDA